MTHIHFATNLDSFLRGSHTVLLIAPSAIFTASKLPKLFDGAVQRLALDLARDTDPGDLGTVVSTLTSAHPHRLCVGVLPDELSRYNSPVCPEGIRRIVTSANLESKGKAGILLILTDESQMLTAINAVGRALPKYTQKTEHPPSRGKIQILALTSKGQVLRTSSRVKVTFEASRDAASFVDMPPSELNPEQFATQAKAQLQDIPGVKIREFIGPQLQKHGLHGIYSVGQAAFHPPRLLLATYEPIRSKKVTSSPSSSKRHIALVGKGITYDTGGLNIKINGTMPSMKADMGGAAATLGAFRVLTQTGYPGRLSLLLCIAENAIGPQAYKPDDVITMHSGKTVEINNTDAEGRLLLADGVSYAVKELGADIVFDAATLTGAQLISTGLMHAAIVSNNAELEQLVIQAGYASGDLVHPLPFAPEFYRQEFESVVADMCNSVRNRFNAQAACAAQFIYWHMSESKAQWCHVDLAGPAFVKNRGTGFGVALLSESIHRLSQ